jgi:hypothetical protein
MFSRTAALSCRRTDKHSDSERCNFTVLFAARHEINWRLVQRGIYQGWTSFPKIYEPLQASRCQAGHKKQVPYLEGPETLHSAPQYKRQSQSTLPPGICAPLARIIYHRFFPELDVLDLQYFSWYNECASSECQFNYQQRRQIFPFPWPFGPVLETIHLPNR